MNNEKLTEEIVFKIWKAAQNPTKETGLSFYKFWEKNKSNLIPVISGIDGNTSDGCHTFKELYDIRLAYNVALFNAWAGDKTLLGSCYHVHKSKKHHDGELCFGGGWFIVCAKLPDGQISNHYPMKYWDLFQIMETEKALFPFDEHTTKNVITRLIKESITDYQSDEN